MRDVRRHLEACVLGTGLLLAALPAGAVGRLLTAEGSGAHIRELRVAVASSEARTSLWVSFGLQGEAGPVSVVIALEPGAKVDPVGEAWLRALEAATAPRVLPPLGQPTDSCGTPPAAVHDTTENRGAWVAPEHVALLTSLEQLQSYAQARGYELKAADLEAIAGMGEKAAYLALGYELQQAAFTETVRISTPTAEPRLPLGSVVRPGSPPVQAVTYSLGAGRARFAGLTELTPSAVPATFMASLVTSDYPEQALALLEAHQGGAAIVEAARPELLSAWSLLGSTAAVMPVAGQYFAFALTREPTDSAVVGCLDALDSVREGSGVVSTLCIGGTWLSAPGSEALDGSCDPEPLPGEIDASLLVCEQADDLAVAFAGLEPSGAMLTRHRMLLTAASPSALRLSWSAAEPQSVVVHAADVNLTGCVLRGAEGATFGGSSRSSTGPTTPPSNAEPPYSTDSVVTSEDSAGAEVELGCYGGAEPSSGEQDSCSGDASTDDSGCSGDSSAESDEETCSGDSSDDDEGETCAGDSSDSGESDEQTCAGDSSDAGAGEEQTCSGDSSGPEGETCALARRRLGRPRLSAVAFGLAALLLPLRRRARWVRRRRRR